MFDFDVAAAPVPGVKIGDLHSDAFGLRLMDISISTPEPNIITLSIPGRDGLLDLSEALTGYITFKNRTLTIAFIRDDRSMTAWMAVYSQIANYCHGRRMPIIFDRDPAYFYVGRVTVSSEKQDSILSSFTLSVDAEPFKYEVASSVLGDWIWDTFNFEADLIREYGSLVVTGYKDFVIDAGLARVVPVFVLESGTISVSAAAGTYQLKLGRNIFDVFVTMPGPNHFTFTGTGVVSVEYQGGWL